VDEFLVETERIRRQRRAETQLYILILKRNRNLCKFIMYKIIILILYIMYLLK